jgi:RNA polymerase sigma factor (sigma-70 family)
MKHVDSHVAARLPRLAAMSNTNAKHEFPKTRWTAVVQLCQADNEAARGEALAGICRDYWYPLYAFARRIGHSQHDAEDLTQSFFIYLVEHNPLATASRELGKLRTFLIAVFRRHIGDVKDRQRAQKRGGRQEFVSLDLLDAEDRYLLEPADPATPESIFERSWALHVLRGALETLRQSEIREGRSRTIDVITPFLDPETTASTSTEDAAHVLGMSNEAMRQTISRLRRKFRDILRQQIAATLHEPGEAEIDDELTALQAALRS